MSNLPKGFRHFPINENLGQQQYIYPVNERNEHRKPKNCSYCSTFLDKIIYKEFCILYIHYILMDECTQPDMFS